MKKGPEVGISDQKTKFFPNVENEEYHIWFKLANDNGVSMAVAIS